MAYIENLNSAVVAATVSDTVAPETVPEKRGRGRPKGSRNKVTLDARAILAKDGLGAVKNLCRIADGRFVLGAPDSDGRRTKLFPNLDQIVAASRVVSSWQIPSLKAVEQTGPGGEPLFDFRGEAERVADSRQVARAVIQVLGVGVVEGNGIVAGLPSAAGDNLKADVLPALAAGADAPAALMDKLQPTSPVELSISDQGGPPERDRMMIGDGIHPQKKSRIEPDQTDGPGPIATSAHAWPDGEPKPVDGFAPQYIGDLGHFIQASQTAPASGPGKFFVHDAAGQRICAATGHSEAIRICTELIETGRVTK